LWEPVSPGGTGVPAVLGRRETEAVPHAPKEQGTSRTP